MSSLFHLFQVHEASAVLLNYEKFAVHQVMQQFWLADLLKITASEEFVMDKKYLKLLLLKAVSLYFIFYLTAVRADVI